RALACSYANCLTIPAVARKFDAGSLFIHQWYFAIETGTIYAWSPQSNSYAPLACHQEGV
ncbi:MAG: hypothetical protein AAF418_04200, partial [Pseudomonadota bacterium]